jgi:hypothetical protein
MMSNAMKGMIAGLVATLILSAIMVLNSATDLMPDVHLIGWLTSLGTLSRPAAWKAATPDPFVNQLRLRFECRCGKVIEQLVSA